MHQTLPPPDRFGHADAWMSPPAPDDVTDLDAWAMRARFHWAAQLLVEDERRRTERVTASATILEWAADRHAGVQAALEVRTDGPGPGPRAIRLDPAQRQLLRGAIVAHSPRYRDLT